MDFDIKVGSTRLDKITPLFLFTLDQNQFVLNQKTLIVPGTIIPKTKQSWWLLSLFKKWAWLLYKILIRDKIDET